MASKNPGETLVLVGAIADSPGFIWYPSAKMTLLLLLPLSGIMPVVPAASTPGSARIRCSDSFRKSTHRRVLAEARARQHDRSGEHMVGLEAGIDGEHALKAREEQARAGEQHERERHLRDDEAAPQQARARARSSRFGPLPSASSSRWTDAPPPSE